MEAIDPDCNVETYPLASAKGTTDMVRTAFPVRAANRSGAALPPSACSAASEASGARPERIGFVSRRRRSACRALVRSEAHRHAPQGRRACRRRVRLDSRVSHAPTMPHKPVPFNGSPVATAAVNKEEVTDELDAILVVDTTKGNRIANYRGFAISPTVKQGVILRVSEDLLDLVEIATGRRPNVFALSMADITPYGNGLYHLNSILQPCTATDAPVVGVAITTETAVPGCATGATHLTDLDEAGTFMLETAKAFGEGSCSFFDEPSSNCSASATVRWPPCRRWARFPPRTRWRKRTPWENRSRTSRKRTTCKALGRMRERRTIPEAASKTHRRRTIPEAASSCSEP